MREARDRWVAVAAIAILGMLAAVIAFLVLDAQNNGIEKREESTQREVQRLANALDARVQQAYTQLASFYGTPGMWNLTPNDPSDAEKLVPLDPTSNTGSFLVDKDGIVVNGSLLRDRSVIGQRYTAEGLDVALRGEPTILGVRPGLTTTKPVTPVTTPIHAADGSLAGIHVIESIVSPESAFAAEVAQLRCPDNCSYTYVDETGTVTASSDAERMAEDAELPAGVLRPGFHRESGRVFAAANVPAARWRLVFEQPTRDFQGDLTGPVRNALFILLAAVVIAGTFGVVALLRRLRAAREEQRRLTEIAAARDEFTSIVSHELRTPVAGLLGFLQTTIDHWDEMSDSERRQAVSRAQLNADRLQQLTLEVLDSTGMESGQLGHELERADLRAIVEDAAETARHGLADRPITVHSDGAVAVDVDPARLRQVLANLIDNAAKSSPPDSPVELTVALVDGEAEVSVRDHGTGIAPEDRERIFDKFVRGRAGLTRGSGLGLYLARQIVHAHGGRIWVGDVDGPGALVVFRLPAVDDRGR